MHIPFKEYEQVRRGTSKETLNEARELELNPNQLKTLQTWVQKKVGANARFTLQSRGYEASVKPDGIHGALCSKYTLKGDVWDASDAKHPNIKAVRVSLNWDYKNRSGNGFTFGTIFIDNDGKILDEQ